MATTNLKGHIAFGFRSGPKDKQNRTRIGPPGQGNETPQSNDHVQIPLESPAMSGRSAA